MQVRLTEHARQRAAEMNVPTKEVKRTVAAPEYDYPSQKYPGARTACGERLAIAYKVEGDTNTAVVITVLWNTRGAVYVRPGS